MPGKVIGKTMNFGFPGSITRNPDTIITPYPCAGDDIQFGDPVVLNEDNTVSRVGADATAASIIGFAVRTAKQAYDDTGSAYYREGDAVDVLIRGNINVKVSEGEPVLRGPVYVRSDTGEIAAEDPGDALVIPNAVFSTGRKDANDVAEVSLLSRSV